MRAYNHLFFWYIFLLSHHLLALPECVPTTFLFLVSFVEAVMRPHAQGIHSPHYRYFARRVQVRLLAAPRAHGWWFRFHGIFGPKMTGVFPHILVTDGWVGVFPKAGQIGCDLNGTHIRA